ncbi:MarR family transcriptional regulator [Protaetiibacter sp. SSC-01]|uniref:MarR family winged helix-turn-helix transcriptional regulator n=1 Tax=Protaetiibacter sp. SSC-01 TaxID=2759943 RepID=UPI001656A136|nr:MarR family transcriptional regulator [Protaetiibacter sp. SSC-01]QNO37356.1 MarR family transcriptional regulator [Protaetiibacter sp. SSC-01]
MTEAGDRQEAVRGLEGAFGELLGEMRRVYAQAAAIASPGMLPGTFKVLSAIERHGSATVSGLADRLAADKGQVSRSVTELEELGFVQRVADESDGRIKLITVTTDGAARLEAARARYEGLLSQVVEGWPVADIERVTSLLQELARGASVPPARS